MEERIAGRRVDAWNGFSHGVFAPDEILFAFTWRARRWITARWADSIQWLPRAAYVRTAHGVYRLSLTFRKLCRKYPALLTHAHQGLAVNLGAVQALEAREKPRQLGFLLRGEGSVLEGERVFLASRRTPPILRLLGVSLREMQQAGLEARLEASVATSAFDWSAANLQLADDDDEDERDADDEDKRGALFDVSDGFEDEAYDDPDD